MAAGGSEQIKYIYELPYAQRTRLCRLLDAGGRWKELGFNYMNMDNITISLLEQAVLRKESPTDELLHKWGERNGTINQLFVYLYKMRHMQAMLIIREFVNPKYHHLLDRQQATEVGSALLSSSYSWKAPYPQCTAPPESLLGHSYSKKIYAEDCNLNLKKLQPVSKVESGKIKVHLTSGLPGQGNRSRRDHPQGFVAPSDSNNNARQGSHGVHTPSQHPAEGKVQNVAGNALEASCRNTNSTSGKDASKLPQPFVNTISYSEIVQATDNFSESHILGKGGFGTVYKGCWKDTTVAIKRLHIRDKDSEVSQEQKLKQSLTELKVLQSFRIDNILPLYGVCLDGPEHCLVYQFMVNGSLEDRLHCKNNTAPLRWSQRAIIAKGTARGLYFLHTSIKGQPLIHGDIKSANILLDSNLEPKIGDFGLTREGPPTDKTHIVVSHLQGTKYYLPPEYLKNRQLSTKVDIYCYGIVLLELATSKHVFDRRRKSKTLIEYVADCAESNQLESLRDASAGDENIIWFSLLIHLGQKCSSYNRKERPEMEEVLRQFKENPNEAVRRLSIPPPSSAPPMQDGTPPSPLDIQKWYDLRQATLQSTPPPFPVPDNSSAPSVMPSAPVPASSRHSPVLPGHPPGAVSPVSPTGTQDPCPSSNNQPQVQPLQQRLASVGSPQKILPSPQAPLPAPLPDNLIPMISALGVSCQSSSASQLLQESCKNSHDSPTVEDDDNSETTSSTMADDRTSEFPGPGPEVIINPDLRSPMLDLPDVTDFEGDLEDLLDDDDEYSC